MAVTAGPDPGAQGSRLGDWINRRLEPGSSVVGEADRRRARYTTLALVILIPFGVVAFFLSLFVNADGTYADEALILLAILGFVALFPLSRSRRHELAAYGALLITSLGIWASWWLARDSTSAADTLFYVAIPVTISGILLPSGRASAFGVANILAILVVVPWHDPSSARWVTAFTRAFFVLALGAIGANAARVRERDLARLEKARRELEEKDAQRLRMLNTIAHDLASPLTPLMLQLELLPRDKPPAPQSLAIMERNLAQMRRLVMDVKDLARHDSGQMRVEKKPTDLADLARLAVETFAEDAKRRGVRLESRVEGPLPLEGDAERLTQVAYNLITNALKFTPAGGTVTLTAKRSGHGIVLTVRDSGRGLTRQEMSRLFQPFSQVHDPGEVKERGTGLGLYISRGIAQAHGGRLTVESQGRGLGSAFTLAIPTA